MTSNRVLLKNGQGAICFSRIRCGKPGCRCARGKLHGPYAYRFYRDRQGRLHRQYIPKDRVAQALADQEKARDAVMVCRNFFRANWTEYRRVRAEINDMTRPYRNYLKEYQR